MFSCSREILKGGRILDQPVRRGTKNVDTGQESMYVDVPDDNSPILK